MRAASSSAGAARSLAAIAVSVRVASGQLARGQLHARRLALRGEADRLVEARHPVLAEEERAACGEDAARRRAEQHAHALLACLEIVDGDVLPLPREERIAVDHRGHADGGCVLDLAHHLALVTDRQHHAAEARRRRDRDHRGRPVVAHAAESPARPALPEELAGARLEREDLARTKAHDHGAGHRRATVERVLEEPGFTARERDPDQRALAADADRDVGADGHRALERPLERAHRGAFVVGPARIEGLSTRLPAAARGEGERHRHHRLAEKRGSTGRRGGGEARGREDFEGSFPPGSPSPRLPVKSPALQPVRCCSVALLEKRPPAA